MPEPEFEILESLRLDQAVRYMAFGLPPLNRRLEKIEGYPAVPRDLFGPDSALFSGEKESMNKHARELLQKLASGKLSATGRGLYLADPTNIHDPYPQWIYSENNLLPNSDVLDQIPHTKDEIIPSEYWNIETIDWAHSVIWDGVLAFDDVRRAIEYQEDQILVGYMDLRICFEDLRKHVQKLPEQFSVEGPVLDTAKKSVTPNYRSPFLDLMLRAEAHFGERLLVAKKSEIEDWLAVEGPKIDPRWTPNKRKSMASYIRPLKLERGGNRKSRS